MKQIKINGDRKYMLREVVKRINNIPEKKKLEIVIRDPRRTSRQNRALHKFLGWLAEALNEKNMFFSCEFLREGYEAQWTPVMTKELFWRPTQRSLTGKESSTKLTTTEFSLVVDTIQQGLAKRGLDVPFPSMEMLLLEVEYQVNQKGNY